MTESVLIDSRKTYVIVLITGILNLLITFPFLGAFLPLPGFAFVALTLRWLKTRSKQGMKLAPIAVIVDLASYLGFSSVAAGRIPQWYLTIKVISWIALIVIFFVIRWELSIIPRPVVELNDEEARRARKALKTRDPDDIMAISKIKGWSF